jgi:hypothetical protein
MSGFFYPDDLAEVEHQYELDLLDAEIKFLHGKCRIMPGFRKFLIMKEDIAFHEERGREYKNAEHEGRFPLPFVEHRNQFNPDKRINDAFDSVNTQTTAALDNAIRLRKLKQDLYDEKGSYDVLVRHSKSPDVGHWHSWQKHPDDPTLDENTERKRAEMRDKFKIELHLNMEASEKKIGDLNAEIARLQKILNRNSVA